MDKIKINDLQVIDSLEKEDQIIVLDASNSSGNSRPDKRATLTQLGDLIHSYMDLDDFYFQSSLNNSVERTILNGDFAFEGDTVQRFALACPQLVDLRDTVRYTLPTGSTATFTEADEYVDSEFDLDNKTIVMDVFAKWNENTDYKMFSIGDHEIWCAEYRDNTFALTEGMYYKNNFNNTVVPLVPLEFSEFPLLRNGRMAFSLKDGNLKISSLGVTRLEYSVPVGTSNIGLNIGGNDRQNFIIGQIIVFDEALDGYDLDKATFMEES